MIRHIICFPLFSAVLITGLLAIASKPKLIETTPDELLAYADKVKQHYFRQIQRDYPKVMFRDDRKGPVK